MFTYFTIKIIFIFSSWKYLVRFTYIFIRPFFTSFLLSERFIKTFLTIYISTQFLMRTIWTPLFSLCYIINLHFKIMATFITIKKIFCSTTFSYISWFFFIFNAPKLRFWILCKTILKTHFTFLIITKFFDRDAAMLTPF